MSDYYNGYGPGHWKATLFVYLSSRPNGCCQRELVEAGFNAEYLSSSLPGFFRAGYIKRKVIEVPGSRPIYYYSLDERGLKFVRRTCAKIYPSRLLSQLHPIRKGAVFARAPTERIVLRPVDAEEIDLQGEAKQKVEDEREKRRIRPLIRQKIGE